MVTSGHGLSLGEHGWIGPTGDRLNEELVHVPLLLRLPKAEQAGRRVVLQTACVDLLPTLVDLCGLDERFDPLGDRFDEVGRSLAQRVAVELGPSVRVTYGPQGGWCRVMGRGQTLVVQE